MKILIFLISMILLGSCKKTPVAISTEPISFNQPANFPSPIYDLSKNPITENGYQLGRRLFYDGRLSRDGTISCAECHSQPYAFTHHGHAISHGIDNKIGLRNAPAIQNTAWMKSFFWDGGVFDLDLFSIAPITNPVEMDESLSNVLDKLRKDDSYKAQFKAAYGSEEINTERFLKALSQFMNALVSANAPYDQYKRKENGVSLSNDQLEGMRIFEQKCSSCHAGELFTDQTFRNNGLEPFRKDPDTGRAHVTGLASDEFKFKVPSLRNIGFTAPYMHDGRFGTLEEVLEHYNSGVVKTPNLDPLLQDGGIPLNSMERRQIIAFLNSLNDESFIKDERFAAPQ